MIETVILTLPTKDLVNMKKELENLNVQEEVSNTVNTDCLYASPLCQLFEITGSGRKEVWQ